MDRSGRGISIPPDGVYGFSMGVELGVDLPTGLPIEGTVTQGLWQPYKRAIRYYYDRFRRTRFLGVGRHLDAHLVDQETGEACNADWPETDGQRDCVVRFGESTWSHTYRGLLVAYSICTASGGCGIPLSWPLSSGALAVGALRDAGDRVQRLCPDGMAVTAPR